MDKIIEKKTGWRVAFTKKALPWWLGVDKDTVTISNVVMGEFNDYIRISGRVQPMTTIQLSPQEGGIVEKILIEEGSPVKAGDAILVLSNDNLDLQILNSEAELAEKENILRNTQIQMEQQKLDVRQNVLEYGTAPTSSRKLSTRTNSSPRRNTLRQKKIINWPNKNMTLS